MSTTPATPGSSADDAETRDESLAAEAAPLAETRDHSLAAEAAPLVEARVESLAAEAALLVETRDASLAAEASPLAEATDAVIRVAAALIVDEFGRLLLVRKAGTSVFMQPGGKYEPGETGAQTLARELHEELGLVIAPDALAPLGTFLAPAANEAGMLVEAEVFRVPALERGATEAFGAGAEIAELRWVHPDAFATMAVAPLVTECMLPLLPHHDRAAPPPAGLSTPTS